MTNDELNEAVGLKLGKLPCPCSCHNRPSYSCVCHMHHPIPYVTDIKVAWEIVEKTKTPGYGFELGDIGDCWTAGWQNADGWLAYAEAATAPLAICKAFLKCP